MGNFANSLHNNFGSRLPVIMMSIVGLGCVLFIAIIIAPQWKNHDDVAAQVVLGQQSIDATMTQVSMSDADTAMQRRIEDARTELDNASAAYLTQPQIDDLMRRIYTYADQSHAKIATLQVQAPSGKNQNPQSTGTVDTRVFHLQVNGSMLQLMNFVVLIRESTTPSVAINALTIAKKSTLYTLTMDVLIHTSSLATGKALNELAGQATASLIAFQAVTSTPDLVIATAAAAALTASPTILPPTSAPLQPSQPVLAPPTATPTLVGQCASQDVQAMSQLYFAKIQRVPNICNAQIWGFEIIKQEPVVLDVVRKSGSGQYRMELRDSTGQLIAATSSSVDGRGILVATPAPNSYTLTLIPLIATGTWIYDIAIWRGLPALSFSWAQNSYSSHTSSDAQSNVMTWAYTLATSPQPYNVEVTRTDGNLEYELSVLDSAGKQVATTKSSNGNAVLNLTADRGTFSVLVTTADGTSGSYRIALVR